MLIKSDNHRYCIQEETSIDDTFAPVTKYIIAISLTHVFEKTLHPKAQFYIYVFVFFHITNDVNVNMAALLLV